MFSVIVQTARKVAEVDVNKQFLVQLDYGESRIKDE